MRLARIDHIRCDEPSGTTFVWVEDSITDEEFQDTVDRVAKEYLVRVKEFMELKKPKSVSFQPNWDKLRDKNVGEVLDEHKAKKEKYSAWEKEQRKARVTFAGLLTKEEGILSFWDMEPGISAEAYWGHNHGLHIEFGETKLMDFKLLKTVKRVKEGRPVQMISEEEDWA